MRCETADWVSFRRAAARSKPPFLDDGLEGHQAGIDH